MSLIVVYYTRLVLKIVLCESLFKNENKKTEAASLLLFYFALYHIPRACAKNY